MMLLQTGQPYVPGHPRRLSTVFAYDIGSPKRARRVRHVLASWRVSGQYSVFETSLMPRERYDLIADLRSMLDVEEDGLVMWNAHGARRWIWNDNRFQEEGRAGADDRACDTAQPCGHFMIAYDVMDADRLRGTHAAIRGTAIAVQRSVYWFQGNGKQALAVGTRMGARLEAGDKLWIYPLSRAEDLWFVVGRRPSLLPTGREPVF